MKLATPLCTFEHVLLSLPFIFFDTKGLENRELTVCWTIYSTDIWIGVGFFFIESELPWLLKPSGR